MLYLTQRVDSPATDRQPYATDRCTGEKSYQSHPQRRSRSRFVAAARPAATRWDVLSNEDGSEFVQIIAADEGVSVVHCDDPFTLAKACYHLGNRHVPLQIMPESCAITTTMCWTICCASSAWRSLSPSCRLNWKPAPTPAKATAIATVIVTIMATIIITSTVTKCQRRKTPAVDAAGQQQPPGRRL